MIIELKEYLQCFSCLSAHLVQHGVNVVIFQPSAIVNDADIVDIILIGQFYTIFNCLYQKLSVEIKLLKEIGLKHFSVLHTF